MIFQFVNLLDDLTVLDDVMVPALLPADEPTGALDSSSAEDVRRLLLELVRQDSDGPSAAFDDRGHVLATADYFTTDRQTTVAYVPTRGVTTVYDLIGDAFAWLCLLTVTALAAVGLVRPYRPAGAGATDRGALREAGR